MFTQKGFFSAMPIIFWPLSENNRNNRITIPNYIHSMINYMSSRIVKYRFNLTPNYKCFIRTRNGKYMETFKMLIYWRKFQRKINCPNFLYSEVWNIDTRNRMLTREKTWNWKIWYLFYLLSILKIFRNWTSFIFYIQNISVAFLSMASGVFSE